MPWKNAPKVGMAISLPSSMSHVCAGLVTVFVAEFLCMHQCVDDRSPESGFGDTYVTVWRRLQLELEVTSDIYSKG